MSQQAFETPTRVLQYLEGGLSNGEVGVIAARTGVGKSALLVHLTLDAILRDLPVLHVTLKDTVDHVRSFYDEIFRAISREGGGRDRSSALLAAERNRMIHSYRDRVFDVAQLRVNIEMLKDIAHFEPRILAVDGLDAASFETHMGGLLDLAKELNLRVWCTVKVKGDEKVLEHELCGRCAKGLHLRPEGNSVRIRMYKNGEQQDLPVALDPTTMLVLGEGDNQSTRHHRPHPADCTLYSGGANGTEAAFGELSEKWGLHEVNFTFDGHKQSRSRGRYLLSPNELVAGDVSLIYVSRRLNRTYSEGSLIRKVLQTLWHMVSRSQQVFVVGAIQEDGTVVGGTGWSVELARMWNKELWVFDQDKNGWYQWNGETWVSGTPFIHTIHFSGTGTRYLNDAGQAALNDLFERSFSSFEG